MKLRVALSHLTLLICLIIIRTIVGERGLEGCADDKNHQIVHRKRKGKKIVHDDGCKFVARKPKKRCKKKFGGAQRARDVCPYSCGVCTIGDDKPKTDDNPDPSNEFVLEGDRMYIGCDSYVFYMKIACGIFGNDSDLCILKSTIVGIASVNGTKFIGGTPVEPFSLYGINIDDLDPDAVCIGSGVFSRDRIVGNRMNPTPMISSDGCVDDQKTPDYMFLVAGVLASDGSNDIQLSFSRDYGFTYYTNNFYGSGIYRAFFSDYSTRSPASFPSEEPGGSSDESSSNSFYPSSAPSSNLFSRGALSDWNSTSNSDGRNNRNLSKMIQRVLSGSAPACDNSLRGPGSGYFIARTSKTCHSMGNSHHDNIEGCHDLCANDDRCNHFAATEADSNGRIYCQLCEPPMRLYDSNDNFKVYSLIQTVQTEKGCHSMSNSHHYNLAGCYNLCVNDPRCTLFAATAPAPDGRIYCQLCEPPLRVYEDDSHAHLLNVYSTDTRFGYSYTISHNSKGCHSMSNSHHDNIEGCYDLCDNDSRCDHFTAVPTSDGRLYCQLCEPPLRLHDKDNNFNVYSMIQTVQTEKGCHSMSNSHHYNLEGCYNLCVKNHRCNNFAATAPGPDGRIYCHLCEPPLRIHDSENLNVYKAGTPSGLGNTYILGHTSKTCHSMGNSHHDFIEECYDLCDSNDDCNHFAATDPGADGRIYCQLCEPPLITYDSPNFKVYSMMSAGQTSKTCYSMSNSHHYSLQGCYDFCNNDDRCSHYAASGPASDGRFYCQFCEPPLRIIDRADYTLYSIAEESLICGQNVQNNVINQIINPPADIQKIISFTIGPTWGVGTIGGDGNPTVYGFSRECASLQGAMGNESAIWLNIDSPQMLPLLLLGDDADNAIDDRCNRGGCQNSPTQRRASTRSGVEKKAQNNAQSGPSPIPLCLAVRPCSRTDPLATFRNGVSVGIFFGGLEIPINSAPEINFSFNGIAASTFGDLVELTMNAGLFEDYKPLGAHLYVEMALKAPIGLGNINIGNLDLTMKGTVYGEFNGNPDAGALINGLLSGSDNGLSVRGLDDSMMQASPSQQNNFRLQFAVNVDAGVTFSLNEITAGLIDAEFPFTFASASAMIEFYMSRSTSWLDLRFSIARDIAAGIQTGITRALDQMSLGEFAEVFTDRIFESFSGRSHAKVMLRVYGDGGIDFGWDIGFTLPFTPCGPIYDAINAVFAAANTFINILNRAGLGNLASGLRDLVHQADELIDEICAAPPPFISFKVKFERGEFDLSKTCFGFNNHELCLDMIPTCPGGRTAPVGERCSANSDCGSGYCLQHPTYKTSIACLGRCMELLPLEGDCSPSGLNILGIDLEKLVNPENEACESGYCRCGTCASGDRGIQNGRHCDENSSCSSGYCRGWVSAGCNGRCVRKARENEDCSPRAAEDFVGALPTEAAHNYCESGQCTCNRCAANGSQRMENGRRCSANSDCQSNNCHCKPLTSRRCEWWDPLNCLVSIIPCSTLDCGGTCR